MYIANTPNILDHYCLYSLIETQFNHQDLTAKIRHELNACFFVVWVSTGIAFFSHSLKFIDNFVQYKIEVLLCSNFLLESVIWVDVFLFNSPLYIFDCDLKQSEFIPFTYLCFVPVSLQKVWHKNIRLWVQTPTQTFLAIWNMYLFGCLRDCTIILYWWKFRNAWGRI